MAEGSNPFARFDFRTKVRLVCRPVCREKPPISDIERAARASPINFGAGHTPKALVFGDGALDVDPVFLTRSPNKVSIAGQCKDRKPIESETLDFGSGYCILTTCDEERVAGKRISSEPARSF